MTSWWFWSVVICLGAGALYCFVPLAGYVVGNVLDLWRERGHVGRVLREAADSRRAADKNAMSTSWLRSHGYGKDGDKVA